MSQSSLAEQNRNPSSPKRVHFINSIIILNKEDEAKEEGSVKSSATEYKDHEMTVKSVEEFEEETEEEIEEEEEDNSEHFDAFPTMKELGYHEWLLKNPRPPWVKAKIRIGNLINVDRLECAYTVYPILPANLNQSRIIWASVPKHRLEAFVALQYDVEEVDVGIA
ncbi:hypothetical protein Tco_0962337 [Tanacetum coccineum]